MGRRRARTGAEQVQRGKRWGVPRLGEASPGPLPLQRLRTGGVTPGGPRTVSQRREVRHLSPPRPKGASMSIRRSVLVLVIGTLVAMLSPLTANAQEPAEGVTCTMPESNAEALVILNNYYPGYWWDHTDLTVAVQAHPSASEAQLDAIDDAIQTWSDVLEDCFDGLITLTQVERRRDADIVVHYVPTAGGVVFGGYAICGDHGCPNILVRSDLPPSLDRDPYDPEYLGWVTLHELGHALGLGHATNLEESTDLMGYGWPELGDPVLSQCDVNALAFVFAWALEGSDPYPPAEAPTSAKP